MVIVKRVDRHSIPVIRELADVIWPATYKEILPEEQIAYMMDLFYSEASLLHQMEMSHQFILALKDNVPVAYASYLPKTRTTFHLQKLYVMPDLQGQGIGQFLLGFIFNDLESMGITTLTLNVNRYNKAVDFYQRTGFKIIKEDDIDIGNGYFMNDYIMQKKI